MWPGFLQSVHLRKHIFKECLVVNLVHDGTMVASVLRVMSGFLAGVTLLNICLLKIVDIGRYVKVSLYKWWLHCLIFLILINWLIWKIFKSLLNSTVGLILIYIFVALFNMGHILIDFININILILYTSIWFLRLSMLSSLLLNRDQKL